MVRYFIIFILVVGYAVVAPACDICACNMGSQLQGLHQLIHRSSIALSFSRARYSSNHEAGVRDAFHTMNLSGTYFLNQSWKLGIQLPYVINHRSNPDETVDLSGFGDVQINGHWVKTLEMSSAQDWKLITDLGMGIKLPTGHFDAPVSGKNLPDNLEVGNGHYALALTPGFGLQRGNWGSWIAGNYLYNFEKKNSYQFGNQWGMQGLVYFDHQTENDWRWIPAVGLNWEYAENNRNVSGFDVADTGGWGLLMPLMMNVRWKDCMFQCSYSIPLDQAYAGGGSHLNNKWNLQLSLFL